MSKSEFNNLETASPVKPISLSINIKCVNLSGSFTVGKIIAQKAAPKLCPVTLELGGKNPNIIMSDADLDIAIQGVIDGMRYTRQGQACTAGSRVYIQEKIYDQVLGGAAEKLSKLTEEQKAHVKERMIDKVEE